MKLTKNLKHTARFAVVATLLSVAVYIVAQYFGLINDVNAQFSPLNAKKEVVEETIEPEKSIQEHVIAIMQDEYGLNWEEISDAIAIIKCESRWNPYAINKNRDGSYDLGLWQINEGYHEITRECAFDVFCSTRYAMQIYEDWGNWTAWVCYK